MFRFRCKYCCTVVKDEVDILAMDVNDLTDFSAKTIDDFKIWSDDALRQFLVLRGRSASGSSDELAARAFVCWEERIPVNCDAEHQKRANLEEYKRKLIANDTVLPDPFGLDAGWFEETEANRCLWPRVFFTDIAEYFKSKSTPDLIHRLCNEYKQGKAYRYTIHVIKQY